MTAPDPSTIDVLKGVGTPTIANVLLRHGLRRTMMQGVRPLDSDQPPLAGVAYTLRFIPSREDLDSLAQYAEPTNLHRRAIEECPAGAVLVIDANGRTDASSMGDLMARRLRSRGGAGVVTDGGFRDMAGIVDTGLPCFQRAPAAPATPTALHPVALNEPIGCGGVAVYPGDLIVGDRDGVVVVPAHLVGEIATAAHEALQYESFAEQEIDRGRSIFEVFPATPESRVRYEKWVAQGRPGME